MGLFSEVLFGFSKWRMARLTRGAQEKIAWKLLPRSVEDGSNFFIPAIPGMLAMVFLMFSLTFYMQDHKIPWGNLTVCGVLVLLWLVLRSVFKKMHIEEARQKSPDAFSRLEGEALDAFMLRQSSAERARLEKVLAGSSVSRPPVSRL